MLFRYAVKRKYCAENPAAPIERVEFDQSVPEVLDVADVRELLKTAAKHRPEMVPHLAIGFFAGLRKAELEGLRWEQIDLAEGIITVTPATAKKRRMRHVKISDNLMAWLLPHRQDNGPVFYSRRYFREIRDNGRFYAGRCPACGHTALPPAHAVCHACIKKGALREYEFVDFGAELEGTVLSWCRLVRGSTKHIGRGEVYPCVVRVDGSDIAMWQYVLPEEGVEIRVGARIRSVLLPQEQRTGEVSDFAFRLIG